MSDHIPRHVCGTEYVVHLENATNVLVKLLRRGKGKRQTGVGENLDGGHEVRLVHGILAYQVRTLRGEDEAKMRRRFS